MLLDTPAPHGRPVWTCGRIWRARHQRAHGPSGAGSGWITPGVLPAFGSFRSLYEHLQRQWWRWDGEFVVSDGYPGFDETGELCGKSQSGPLWFLAAGSPFLQRTERTCQVPPGKALYLPVALVICSALLGDDPADLQGCASGAFDEALAGGLTMSATLDGRPVSDILGYRTQTGMFALTLPDDNGYGVPSGSAPAAADGVGLVLLPPRPGTHVVEVIVNFGEDPSTAGSLQVTLVVGKH